MTKFQHLVIRIREEFPSAKLQITPPADKCRKKGVWWMDITFGHGDNERVYTIRGEPHEPFGFDDSRNSPSGEASRERFKTVKSMMVKLRAISKAHSGESKGLLAVRLDSVLS